MFGVAVGSKERGCVSPPEVFIVIEGQIYNRKVSPELTAKVVTFATRRPKERLYTIQQGHGGMQAPVSRVKIESFFIPI
jgi:eukaryotic translation initiation factor 2C